MRLVLSFIFFVRSIPVELDLNQGKIYGNADDLVEIYRGVPYAAPPLGDLRWRPTVKGLEIEIGEVASFLIPDKSRS